MGESVKSEVHSHQMQDQLKAQWEEFQKLSDVVTKLIEDEPAEREKICRAVAELQEKLSALEKDLAMRQQKEDPRANCMRRTFWGPNRAEFFDTARDSCAHLMAQFPDDPEASIVPIKPLEFKIPDQDKAVANEMCCDATRMPSHGDTCVSMGVSGTNQAPAREISKEDSHNQPIPPCRSHTLSAQNPNKDNVGQKDPQALPDEGCSASGTEDVESFDNPYQERGPDQESSDGTTTSSSCVTDATHITALGQEIPKHPGELDKLLLRVACVVSNANKKVTKRSQRQDLDNLRILLAEATAVRGQAMAVFRGLQEDSGLAHALLWESYVDLGGVLARAQESLDRHEALLCGIEDLPCDKEQQVLDWVSSAQPPKGIPSAVQVARKDEKVHRQEKAAPQVELAKSDPEVVGVSGIKPIVITRNAAPGRDLEREDCSSKKSSKKKENIRGQKAFASFCGFTAPPGFGIKKNHQRRKPYCLLCEKENHSLPTCRAFKRMIPNERLRFCQEKHLHFVCLARHKAGQCRIPEEHRKCQVEAGCKYQHHRLLHDARFRSLERKKPDDRHCSQNKLPRSETSAHLPMSHQKATDEEQKSLHMRKKHVEVKKLTPVQDSRASKPELGFKMPQQAEQQFLEWMKCHFQIQKESDEVLQQVTVKLAETLGDSGFKSKSFGPSQKTQVAETGPAPVSASGQKAAVVAEAEFQPISPSLPVSKRGEPVSPRMRQRSRSSSDVMPANHHQPCSDPVHQQEHPNQGMNSEVPVVLQQTRPITQAEDKLPPHDAPVSHGGGLAAAIHHDLQNKNKEFQQSKKVGWISSFLRAFEDLSA
jgi:hypothetical protein